MSYMLPVVKLSDYQPLQMFLTAEKAATLAVPIDENGTIHAASLLYYHKEDPLRVYFITGKNTEKYTLLHTKASIPAALVVGTTKGTPFTVQLRGSVAVANPNTHAAIIDSYYEKRGNRGDDIANPDYSLLVFTPKWGRFTDYKSGYEQYLLDLT